MTNQIAATTGNQITTLKDQLSAATERVTPASEDAVKSKLLMLQRAGLEWPPSVDQLRAPEIYVFALKRVPLHALSVAVERIVQGEEGVDRYIPTPPAMAALVRRIAAPLVNDVARIREAMSSIEEGRRVREPDGPEREASKARVRAMVAGVLDANREMNARKPAEELSEEETDRLFRNRVEDQTQADQSPMGKIIDDDIPW